MTLQYPFWLLMALPLGMLWYAFRLSTKTLNILRGTLLLLLILALCEPSIKLRGRHVSTVVVVDRSESMPSNSDETGLEIISIIQAAMRGEDRLGVVTFGEQALVEQPPQVGDFPGFVNEPGKERSDLNHGINLALSLIPKNRTGRILLISDGRWTGKSPGKAAINAASRGCTIDYRCLSRPQVNDIAIEEILAPSSAAPRESYIITAWIRVPSRQPIQYRLVSNGKIIAAGSKPMKAGMNRLMFRDTAGNTRAKEYLLSVSGDGDDPLPQNNIARKLVGVNGEKPILCITPSPNSALPPLLKKSGLNITSIPARQCDLSLTELSNYSAVLLENVSANNIGIRGMRNIAVWVEQSGAGFMMTGGKNSFGPGGYFKSPIERIMPVSMELRKEHRKLKLAIAVALDRSGSMAMSAGGGQTKMDLANLGTVQVLDLLSNMDEMGVIAVDSSAHTIVNLASLDKNRGYRSRILKIDSMGGGIFVYEALVASVKMLNSATAGTRHIILFADAADAEQPGKYKSLLAKCHTANITVSVVGLGKPTDSDAAFLEDVAKRGGGRCFFTSDPLEIPRLFAQDTFCVARSTFIEENTTMKITGGWPALFAATPATVPAIGGYNLCYLREGATPAAISEDEYNAPIIASWNAGSGRVLCYTGEADGKFTGHLAQWPDAGKLFSSMARWTVGARGKLPLGMMLTHDVKDGIYRIELHLNPERKEEPIAQPPIVNILRGHPGSEPQSTTYSMLWESADLLACEIPFIGSETILPTVEIADHGSIPLSPACLPYSPEFNTPDGHKGVNTLKHIADATGGKERTDLAQIWESSDRRARYIPIAHWLLITALIILLLEILQRRTGILHTIHKTKTRETAPDNIVKEKTTPHPKRKKKTPRKKSAPASTVAPPPENESTLAAMRRARHRARHRTQR